MDLQKSCWVLDGGLATEIENKGFHIQVCDSLSHFQDWNMPYPFLPFLPQNDPLWSARLLHTHPAVIAEIHRSYLEQGADIITTASYQVSIGDADFTSFLCHSLVIAPSQIFCALQVIKSDDRDEASLVPRP